MPKQFLPLIALSVLLCACGEQKKAEDAVAQMASDPENVTFRNVTKSKLDDKTFCGEFRSKEGPSTWGEFKQFTSDGVEVLIVEKLPTDFDSVLQRLGPGHTQSDIDSLTDTYNQTARAMEQYRLCKYGL